nr:FAD-dependent monooxygenase [Arthrobacter sp. E3]
MLTRSNTDSVSAFKFNAADPEDLAPWKSSRVTAIGDAVHAMPPTGGQGAATAIIDADVLTERLHAAERGEATLVVAVHDSENDLRTRAAPVVRESLQPVDWIRATASPTGAFLLRTLTPLFAVGSAAAHTAAQKWRR